VEFVNTEGLQEAGIDGGGLFKDFLTELIQTAFSHQYALFKVTAEGQLYPNPASSLVTEDHLNQFEFLGRMVGKALYDSVLIDLPLAKFFLSKILGKFNSVNDLVSLDEQLYKNLISLKNLPAEDLEDIGINFSVVENEFGESREIELIAGGREISTTEKDNLIRYIHLVANYKLNFQILKQSRAFLKGFSDLIAPEWIRMFNQDELQLLISGSPAGIDIADMRRHTNYSGGFSGDHPTIQIFWEVLAELSPDQQQNLLKFVTSCSRPPLLGFQYLYPQLCIHKSLYNDDINPEEHLPTASTCMNLLKMVPYRKKKTLKEKLIYAINSNAGFDLS